MGMRAGGRQWTILRHLVVSIYVSCCIYVTIHVLCSTYVTIYVLYVSYLCDHLAAWNAILHPFPRPLRNTAGEDHG